MVQIDIEMPKYCYDCPCHNGENGRCNITGDSTYDKRPFDCPLKEGKNKIDDLISRQVAIDAIRASTSKYTGFMGMEMYTEDDAVEAINSVSSTQSNWIPCSEVTGDGYPKEKGVYYVTEQNYGFYLDAPCKQRVTHTSRFENGRFIDRSYIENYSNITAWMPPPKPYEGEQDDN